MANAQFRFSVSYENCTAIFQNYDFLVMNDMVRYLQYTVIVISVHSDCVHPPICWSICPSVGSPVGLSRFCQKQEKSMSSITRGSMEAYEAYYMHPCISITPPYNLISQL